MFVELMPSIENRPFTITLAALSEGRIRVNVVPRTLEKDGTERGHARLIDAQHVARAASKPDGCRLPVRDAAQVILKGMVFKR
jgi:hypothetical protein